MVSYNSDQETVSHPMDGSLLEPVVKDMSTTRSEFFRSLGIALRGMPSKIEGNHIVVGDQGHEVHMDLSPLPPRKLSSMLVLERWKLTISFKNYTREEQDHFLQIFDHAFHRGGG